MRAAVERHALASTIAFFPGRGSERAKYQCPLVCGPRQLVISPRTVMGPRPFR